VGQLDGGGGVEVGVGGLPEAPRQEHKGRPESLPAGGEELAHLSGERWPVGADRAPDPDFEAVEILCNGAEEAGL